MEGRILVVDDDRDMCDLLEIELRHRGFEPIATTTGREALELLKTQPFDVALADLNMPDLGGIELCARIAEHGIELPVIVVTAFGSLETAVEAMRAGAYDFITKPVDMELLEHALKRAVGHRRLTAQVASLSEAVERARRFDDLLGESAVMQRLFRQLEQIGDTAVSVLIEGDSGTGKELAARALHRRSARSDGPFVALNCAALPEALLESELFGHVKGAFTDAHRPHRGLFLQADGGTLFMDEIGELPIGLQPKLLRAIEERTVRPVGAEREEHFDIRLVCATNQSLDEAVEAGRFREDLYYRINVVRIELPPLRARGSDILLLARHFVDLYAAQFDKQVNGISRAAASKLVDYAWPGNVRELRNAIERAVALCQLEKIQVEDLPDKVRDFQRAHVILAGANPEELITLAEVEQRYIAHVLEATEGNKAKAARILGLDRKTLYRKLSRSE